MREKTAIDDPPRTVFLVRDLRSDHWVVTISKAL